MEDANLVAAGRAHRSILLIAAFAALSLIIGTSCFAIWQNAKDSQHRVAALHAAHLQAGTALAAIRNNIYLAGILTRDYLLDSDPPNATSYSSQLTNLRAGTDEKFAILEALGLEGEQKDELERFRHEVGAYLDTSEVVLEWSPQQKRVQGAEMLRIRAPRRRDIMALAEKVEQEIAADFSKKRQQMTTADQAFRSYLGWATAIALLLGCAIAGLTVTRIMALEHKSRAAESQLRLLSGQIRTAQEQERKYLSRELHDQVGQMLTGLRMELASLSRNHGLTEAELSLRIERAKGTAEQTLRIVRDIAMLLRPSMLDDLGLTPALAWLVKEVSRSGGIEISSHVDPSVASLPDAHRTCIYRVVQEALTNATRHAGARRVEATVETIGEWVVGTIVDDGRGFDVKAARPKSLGLLGMEERIRELGGSLRVNSAPGRGTRIEFRLPRPAGSEVPDVRSVDSGRPRHSSDRVETSA